MKNQKYGEYREAWHLLVEACRRKEEGPIDFQACAEEEVREFETGEAASPANSQSAIREMFCRSIRSSEGDRDGEQDSDKR